jgi:ER-bound oxygenase mpaB/B'/Rubber oxygenase, catalytic domain
MLTGIAINVEQSPVSLEKMRDVGDEDADAAIDYWVRVKGRPQLKHLAEDLVGFQFAPEIDWLLQELVHANAGCANKLDPRRQVSVCGFPKDDPQERQKVLEPGQKVFREHGLKILVILACSSLPAAYAAQKGVRVLHSRSGSTGYFVKNMNRRLMETVQFVIEVFANDGLAIDANGSLAVQGAAIQSSLRVRLLHAAVRGLILTKLDESGQPAWDTKGLGVPANQEDLAGTLMTFSIVVLDGLRKMHAGLTPAEEEAYFEIWKRVGRLLGVTMIPQTVKDGKKLTEEIRSRQVDGPIREGNKNPDGSEMTKNLLDFLREQLPWGLSWLPLPEALMLFFLPREPADVPDSLKIRRTRTRGALVAIIGFWFWVESRITRFAIFNFLNRLLFVQWNQEGERAFSLLQLSRHMGRRVLRQVLASPRNAGPDQNRPKFNLHDWEERWALKQTANPVERARMFYDWTQGREHKLVI